MDENGRENTRADSGLIYGRRFEGNAMPEMDKDIACLALSVRPYNCLQMSSRI